MKNPKLISVIIPFYNSEKFLARCLRSILNQSLPSEHYEVILVDDGSQDKSDFIADIFREDITIIKFDRNKGLPSALNAGIMAADSKYIIRLDADDYVNRDYLNILSNFLEQNHDFDAVSCDYFMVDDKENIIRRCNADLEPIGCGIMFRTEQLLRLGLYDESFFINEEIDLRKRFIQKHNLYHVPLPLYRYRRHNENLTNDVEKKLLYDAKINQKHMHDELEINPIIWSGRSQKYTEDELNLMLHVVNTADPLTQGQYQTKFEQDFLSYLGNIGHAYAVSSATAAIELAAMLCQFQPDDEIIIPAHTFAASAIPFARYNGKIKWADIDIDTRVIKFDSVANLITDKTKAIVAVHLYGNAAPVDQLSILAKQHNLFLIEDAAQALGGDINGKKLGTYGDFSCFSFHSHKNITTLGEGGILWLKDSSLARLVPGLRHNGLRKFESQECYWKPAMSNVDFDIGGLWPYNFCLSEVQCALGSALLKRNDSIIKKRTQRAKVFIQSFKDFPELVFQQTTESSKHCWHLLAAMYRPRNPRVDRNNLIELLFKKYNVKTVVQYYPLYRYPMFIKGGFAEADCPNTDLFFDNMISFPFHEWMSEEDFTTMIKRVREALLELRA